MDNAPELGIRVGDGERAQAVAALDMHVADGRLAPGEHEDRTRRALEARTRAELADLFADLPEPRPVLTSAVVARPADPDPVVMEKAAVVVRAVGFAVFVTGIPTAVVMTVLFGLWFLFLPVTSAFVTLMVLSTVLSRVAGRR